MSNEIRAVLIPIEKGRKLLLPNATVAEIMGYKSVDISDTGKKWIIGSISWRGWQLPLIDFAILTGSKIIPVDERNCNIAILKSINHPDKLPYFAVLSRGIPKLQLISRGDMQMHEDKIINHNAIASLVSVKDETADIPNMNFLETKLIELQA
ncbi:MAG: chemotaxis protein CheW [Proteobacteria bacterium]|nr:chemotaxis protein CheW [Pseudomonadota bacterium]